MAAPSVPPAPGQRPPPRKPPRGQSPQVSAPESGTAQKGDSAPTDAQPPGRTRRRPRLGEILVKAGVVTEEDVRRALDVQKMGGGRLGGVLVRLKCVTDAQIRQALAEQLGIEVIELDDVEVDEGALKALPRELIKKYEAVPVRLEEGTLYVAMKDPYNFTAVDDIRFFTGLKVVVLACTESDYSTFIEEQLQAQSLIEEILEGGDFYDRAISSVDKSTRDGPGGAEDGDDELIHDLRLAGAHPPIITLCNFLLVESIQRRASDIHIEPYETYLRVRIRVDGRLQTLLTPPQRLAEPMITRMKIMGDMDIAIRRAPQDGHIALVYRGETCHYRVSTLPTVYGEKCVIRLLKKQENLTELDTLGLGDTLLKRFRKSIRRPQGIVLVTGPTGSGKTTTLHAALHDINDPETNIVTLEDPVEASLPGINHVQINNKAGITFASGLRSILRQDPDVIFVGEIRDPEVAQIAVKASLTGHLVMSTLHTNSAAESLMRLEDIGIPAYLLANALVVIIAQRLVRRVCKLCTEPYLPSEDEVTEFRLTPAQLENSQLSRGVGCEACYNTGYHGRLAIYESLFISNELRTLVRQGAPIEKVLEQARDEGFSFLFEAGIEGALAGITSLAEVRRTLSDAR